MQTRDCERLEALLAKRLEQFQAGQIHCAETVLLTMTDYCGWESDAIPRIATAFGGGIATMQNACGAYVGGAMSIGMFIGRDVPGGDREPAVALCKELRAHILAQCGAVDCRDILQDVDLSDPEQRAAFRLPGAKHHTVCEPLVASVCRFLAERFA